MSGVADFELNLVSDEPEEQENETGTPPTKAARKQFESQKIVLSNCK